MASLNGSHLVLLLFSLLSLVSQSSCRQDAPYVEANGFEMFSREDMELGLTPNVYPFSYLAFDLVCVETNLSLVTEPRGPHMYAFVRTARVDAVGRIRNMPVYVLAETRTENGFKSCDFSPNGFTGLNIPRGRTRERIGTDHRIYVDIYDKNYVADQDYYYGRCTIKLKEVVQARSLNGTNRTCTMEGRDVQGRPVTTIITWRVTWNMDYPMEGKEINRPEGPYLNPRQWRNGRRPPAPTRPPRVFFDPMAPRSLALEASGVSMSRRADVKNKKRTHFPEEVSISRAKYAVMEGDEDYILVV